MDGIWTDAGDGASDHDSQGRAEGEQVPSEWVLPQEPITEADLDDYLERNADMPSLHYAEFGGEDLPGFPDAWRDR